jgi:two-component system, OmpR family, sensor histidine kinase KdpD
MDRSRSASGQLALRCLALTGVVLVVAFLYRRILHANDTTVALTFLVLVQLVALRWGLAVSIYLSIACSLAYDYFFLPPVGTFTIADSRNWIALGVFLGSAFLVSNLSEAERRHAEISETRRREVERLYTFSQQLLMEDHMQEFANHAPRIVASIFEFAGVALYVAETDSLHLSDPENEFVSINQMRAVAQAPEAPHLPLPGARIVPLMLGMRASGSLAVIDAEFSDGLYVAIGGLIAIALARAAAIERFSLIEAGREGERLRAALLDSITHELRTPLTAIRLAATSLLSQPRLGEGERREMVSVIDEESARLDRLIGQAVEMAQLDSDSVQPRPRPLSVRAVIDAALEESHGVLRGRQVIVSPPGDLPVVPMDGELIRRVLRHLLENAARYSPAGTPVRVTAAISDGRLLLSVRDEGQGIDEAEQPFIFDKFYRGRRHRQRLQGTGMGLAIARAILRAHKGGIDVISHPNEGSTFTFWIPVEGVAGRSGYAST